MRKRSDRRRAFLSWRWKFVQEQSRWLWLWRSRSSEARPYSLSGPPQRHAIHLSPMRSSARTPKPGTRRANGTSAAPATPTSRASPPTSASIRGRRSTSRSTRPPPTTASTSTGWATTAATAPARWRRCSPRPPLPQTQPACLTEPATGLVDCGNWAESASWAVPADAVSGIYFAKLVREDVNSEGSHIMLRRPRRRRALRLLFQTSDTTWQAYNQYGGNSLYVGGPGTNPGRAYKVSYNRPLTVRGTTLRRLAVQRRVPDGPLARAQRLRRQLLHRRRHRSPRRRDPRAQGLPLGRPRRVLVRRSQRANVEAARDAGVNLAFFSGNEIFWKTRWENSIDGSGTDHRTLVCYKETHANAKIDPTSGLDRDLARSALQPARRRRPPRERAHRHDLHGQLLARPRSRCPRRTARCASGATPASPRWRRARQRRSPRTRSATSGTKTSTTASGPPACRPLLDHRQRARAPPRPRLQLRPRHSDPPPDPLPRLQRRAGLRRRHDPVVLGARRRRTTAASQHADSACSRRPSTCSPTWARSRQLPGRPGARDRRSTDTTPPTSTIANPADGSKAEAGTPVTITGTAGDDGGD